MGLSAGQARLLTITARKSDCEFSSMRLSHQKIALARELADLSNEYQNSLTRTKLTYDYYGSGDTTTPLTYGLMMNPSALNDFMPITLTDSMGRVTLNNKYAAAARAAGIPQEGLGILPSEDTRNKFIQGLFQSGLVNNAMASTIIDLPYNQQAGLGGGITVACQTRDVSYDDLKDLLNVYGGVNPSDSTYNDEYVRGLTVYNTTDFKYIPDSKGQVWHYGGIYQEEPVKQISLGDILEKDYVLVSYGMDEYNSALGAVGGTIDAACNAKIWDFMFDSVEDLLDTGDTVTRKALEYARDNIEYMISNQCDQSKGAGFKGCENEKAQYNNGQDLVNFAYRTGGSDQAKDVNVANKALSLASTASNGKGYIGLCLRFNCGKGKDNDSDISAVSVNISSVLKAYLTYFTDYMNGLAEIGADGRQVYEVTDKVSTSHLVDSTSMFTVKLGQSVSSDALQQATFYDALFNQICLNGWTENNEIMNKDYLRQMLQSGMMLVSRVADDGFYYQGNYATDSYIKEVSDDAYIAQAEAKYSTEKAKLNAKEETLDLKMKNLDTEISSLTTEYDTIKNTISKNIEKVFKRYNA